MKKHIVALHLIIFCSIIADIKSSQQAEFNIIKTFNDDEFRKWYLKEIGIDLLPHEIDQARTEWEINMHQSPHPESSVPHFDRTLFNEPLGPSSGYVFDHQATSNVVG